MIDAIVCDIEGTTTSLAFVQEVLFPLSKKRMKEFLTVEWNSGTIDEEIRLLQSKGEITLQTALQKLLDWIDQDKKETALKSIQGKIWKAAFESGTVKGHVYADVPPAFQRWHERGIPVYIFSSGSVEAQKLLFRYSEAADLTGYITGYFDTTIGSKREPNSFRIIAQQIKVPAAKILFLSDAEAELDSAKSAGLQTIQIVRGPETPVSVRHEIAQTFEELDIKFERIGS